MRTLSTTLLSAQQSASRVPYVRLEARNTAGGIVRLDWTRLYSGAEAAGIHTAVMPADGSLIRVRVTPVESGQVLYRQRVINPGPSSTYSVWANTGLYGVLAVACCSLSSEVSIFWIDSSRKLQRLISSDNGATWTDMGLLDYVASTSIYGMSAAYKSNGDVTIFFADANTIGVKKQVGGTWQSISYWDKTTGDSSGVACTYDGDWKLLVTGKDTAGNFRLWSLVYGDGREVASGHWSDLKVISSAPSGGDFEYCNPSIDKPDVFRCFYTERFTGQPAGSRSFWSHSVPGTGFSDNLFREPVPFSFTGDCGLVMVHAGSYAWLTCPYGVWQAPLDIYSVDLSNDVINIKAELSDTSGNMVVELRNDDCRYSSAAGLPGIGYQFALSPGYRTVSGNESSSGMSFSLEAYEYVGAGGKSSMLLYCFDGWAALSNWTARCQFRWNKDSDEMSVKQIIQFILGRAGLKVETKSQSSVITGFYPDFTIQPGNSGDTVVRKLLSMVPDVLFIEGDCVCLVNPQPSDAPVYAYGTGHVILEGRFRCNALTNNRVQVEGYDPDEEVSVVLDSFDWMDISRVYDRIISVIDINIASESQAQDRGISILRKQTCTNAAGYIRIPVNCGQQVYDVISVTDSWTGLENITRRVVGISLIYNRIKGQYEQRLILGGV
jgi:hypothetical protein